MVRTVLTRLIALVLLVSIGLDWLSNGTERVWVQRRTFDALWDELDVVIDSDTEVFAEGIEYRLAVAELAQASQGVSDMHFRAEHRSNTVRLWVAGVLLVVVMIPGRWFQWRAPLTPHSADG